MAANLCCQDRMAGYVFLPLSCLCSHLILPSEKACLVIPAEHLEHVRVRAWDSPTLWCSGQGQEATELLLLVWCLLWVVSRVHTMRRKYFHEFWERRGGERENISKWRLHCNWKVPERKEGIPEIALKVTCSCSMVQNPRNMVQGLFTTYSGSLYFSNQGCCHLPWKQSQTWLMDMLLLPASPSKGTELFSELTN